MSDHEDFDPAANADFNTVRPDFSFSTAKDFDNPLSPPPPVVEEKRSRRRAIVASAAGLALVALAATGAVAYETLASSGLQPEHVIPANAVAFGKVDLDPSAGQKVAVYRLARKFPSLRADFTNKSDIQDSLLNSAFAAKPSDWNYQQDVKPWLGSRIAVAAVPDSTADSGFDPILAVAFTNQAKMTASLTKARDQGMDFGYTIVKSYVLITDTPAHAQTIATAAAAGTMDGNRTYNDDVRALPGAQVADAWVDLAAASAAERTSIASHLAIAKARGDGEGADALATLPKVTGRFVMGLHANADYLELTGMVRGAARVTAGTPAAKIQKLPSNLGAALEIAGVGASLTKTWNALTPAMRTLYQPLADEFGITLPADLGAVFGTDLVVGMQLGGAEPKAAVDVTTAQGARAVAVINKLLAQTAVDLGEPIKAVVTGTGYVLGNDPAFTAAVGAGSGKLGESSTFRSAVPNAAGASMIGFINVGALLGDDPSMSPKDRADLAHVSAVGASVTTTAAGSTFTVRVTTK